MTPYDYYLFTEIGFAKSDNLKLTSSRTKLYHLKFRAYCAKKFIEDGFGTSKNIHCATATRRKMYLIADGNEILLAQCVFATHNPFNIIKFSNKRYTISDETWEYVQKVIIGKVLLGEIFDVRRELKPLLIKHREFVPRGRFWKRSET